MSKLKPYYKQIADELAQDILDGKFRAGSRMPTEKQLQERFYVSRMTVRQAYRLLEKNGTVTITKNKGVFVKDISLQRNAKALCFTDLIDRQGLQYATKVGLFEKQEADEIVQKKLKLEEGEEVYFFKRYRYVKDELVLFENVNLPAKLFPGLEQYDFAKDSLYEVLKNDYNTQVDSIEDEVSIRLIYGEEAHSMYNAKSAPALVIKIVASSIDGTPIEYSEMVGNYRVFSYKVSHDNLSK